MSEDEYAPITLSREDLYELVWSKPMRELAKDFGISDVALAKRCRRLGIPVPGRGYWARVDAGQQPYRPKLPKREPERSDQGALTVAPSADAPAIANGPPAAAEDQVWLAQRLAFEKIAGNSIEVPITTRRWDPSVQAYREYLEAIAEEMRLSRKASDRYDKWPESRKRVESEIDAWRWRQAKDRGQRLRDYHKPAAFRVSLETYNRALSIINALAVAAASRGFAVSKDDKIGRIVFTGHNADIQMRITEMLQQKTRQRVRYDGKTETENYQIPTGRLRLTLQTGYREGPSFEDGDASKLESQLNRVFSKMYRLVVKVWERDREHLQFQLRLEEQSRRRAEEERIRAERQKVRADELDRRRRLSIEAIRWSKSQRIREYIAHIQTTTTGRSGTPDMLGDWIDWALSVASELDPTEMRLSKKYPK